MSFPVKVTVIWPKEGQSAEVAEQVELLFIYVSKDVILYSLGKQSDSTQREVQRERNSIHFEYLEKLYKHLSDLRVMQLQSFVLSEMR